MATLFATDRLFHLRLDGPAIAQPRHKLAIRGRRFPIAYIPKDHPVHNYKGFVRLMARQRWKWPPLEGPLESQVLFVSEVEGGGDWKGTAPDCDNYLKSLMDALQGIVYLNDSQIAKIEASKRFRSAWEKPFVEIVIRNIPKEERPPVRLFAEEETNGQ